jgi:hypothetical protein
MQSSHQYFRKLTQDRQTENTNLNKRMTNLTLTEHTSMFQIHEHPDRSVFTRFSLTNGLSDQGWIKFGSSSNPLLVEWISARYQIGHLITVVLEVSRKYGPMKKKRYTCWSESTPSTKPQGTDIIFAVRLTWKAVDSFQYEYARGSRLCMPEWCKPKSWGVFFCAYLCACLKRVFMDIPQHGFECLSMCQQNEPLCLSWVPHLHDKGVAQFYHRLSTRIRPR